MRILLILPAFALLAACGNMEPLQPKAGQGMPARPAMAARAPTTDELLTPPPYARPARQDDGLRRSEEREDDPFDLPPDRLTVGAELIFPETQLKKVRKAVFPVAGLGTRFLPATKAVPKEMLTVVDRPLIQYAVEEALEAGIEQMIFVTGRGKTALEDHFDIAYELEAVMRGRGKSLDILDSTRMPPGSVVAVRQQEPLGLGHAVWCAREIVGDEPFAVFLPDEVMVGSPNCTRQLVDAYEKVGGNVVAMLEVPPEETHKYGVVSPGATDGKLTEILGLVEKPAAGTAPSNLMLPGRYILQPEIMEALGKIGRGAGGEIQLTDAMAAMIGLQPFHGLVFDGERHDCGHTLGFVIANVALALKRDDVAPALRDWLARL